MKATRKHKLARLRRLREDVDWEAPEEGQYLLHLLYSLRHSTGMPIGTRLDYAESMYDLYRAASSEYYCQSRRNVAKNNWVSVVRNIFDLYAGFAENREELEEKHCQVVGKYLQLGQDTNCLDPETGNSLLHISLQHGSKRTMDMVIKHGANPNLANRKGLTPLHVICDRTEDDDLVEMFFHCADQQRNAVQMDVLDQSGNAPLHYAVARGYKVRLIDTLLRRGADPNVLDAGRSTPLHVIAKRQCCDDDLADRFLETVERVRRYAVNIDARDRFSRTVLQLAVENVAPRSVDAILRRGADVSRFCFPDMRHFVECFKRPSQCENYKLTVAAGLLFIVKRLRDCGYELVRSQALMIMTFFDTYYLFEELSNSDDFTKRMAKTFFHSWALDPFFEMTNLPLICCDMVLERLAFEDLYSICLSVS